MSQDVTKFEKNHNLVRPQLAPWKTQSLGTPSGSSREHKGRGRRGLSIQKLLVKTGEDGLGCFLKKALSGLKDILQTCFEELFFFQS